MLNQQSTDEDIVLSFRLIALLSPGFQGSYVASEILLKLGHPSKPQVVQEFAGRMLNRIGGWMKSLVEARETVVKRHWSHPESEEARLAWQMIDSLRLELSEVRELSRMILSVSPDELSEAELSWCVAQYGRQLYAGKDQWLLRLVYGGLSNSQRDIDQAEQALQGMAGDFDELDRLVDSLLLGDNGLGVRTKVLEKVRGVLRYANLALYDLCVLAHCFETTITYSMLDFSKDEEQEWSRYGFTPLIAGWWRVFGYSTGAEASSWVRLGWNTPQECMAWYDKRFGPNEAKEWLDLGIDSDNAREWRRAGFTATKARPYIEKGMRVPPNKRRL